jgi:hypothetical protein
MQNQATMKIPLLLLVCLAAVTCQAQNITKVTTLAVHSERTNQFGVVSFGNATNFVVIPLGEAARISTIKSVSMGLFENNYGEFWYIRDGWYWEAIKGDIVPGPATFIIELTADSETSAVMTLERWKISKK